MQLFMRLMLCLLKMNFIQGLILVQELSFHIILLKQENLIQSMENCWQNFTIGDKKVIMTISLITIRSQ